MKEFYRDPVTGIRKQENFLNRKKIHPYEMDIYMMDYDEEDEKD